MVGFLEICGVILISCGFMAILGLICMTVAGYTHYSELADFAKNKHKAHLQSAEFINSLIDTIEEYDASCEIINGCELSLYNKCTRTHIYIFPKSFKDYRDVLKHIEEHDEYLRLQTMTEFFETYFDEKEQ